MKAKTYKAISVTGDWQIFCFPWEVKAFLPPVWFPSGHPCLWSQSSNILSWERSGIRGGWVGFDNFLLKLMENGSWLANQMTLKYLWAYVTLIWCQVDYIWNQLKTQAVQPTWRFFLFGSFEVEWNTIHLWTCLWKVFACLFVCFLHSCWRVHLPRYWGIHSFTGIRNYYLCWILA